MTVRIDSARAAEHLLLDGPPAQREKTDMNELTEVPRSRSPFVRVVALLAVAAASVLGGVGVAAPASAADGMATSWVRAAHLVPGMGSMDITLVPFSGAASGDVTKPGVPEAKTKDGARLVESATTYGTAGDYRQVPQGLYTVMVRPNGADPSSPPLLTGTVDAKADQAYTLAALGTKDAPRVQVLSDDLRPPKAGKASVRLLPVAKNATAVTVTAVGGPTLTKDATFGRPTGYAAVPAGPWTLQVATASASAGKSVGSEVATGNVNLRSGAVYTVLVLDNASGGVTLKPLLDAEGVATAPMAGVQTGAGGTAGDQAGTGWTRGASLGGGLALATAGAIGLALVLRRRPVLQPSRRR